MTGATTLTPDASRALNLDTFPGVPAAIERLWGQWPAWRGSLEPGSVEKVLDGCSVIVNAMAGGEHWQVGLNEGMTAATDLRHRRVQITSAALADERLAAIVRLAITAGMAVHEAGHGRITGPMSAAVEAAFSGPRLALAARLSNIGEDVRLERQTSEDWPAYAGVFPLTLWWVAQRYPTGTIASLPASRDQAVNFAIAAVRYSAHTVWAGGPAVEAERDWWQAWGQRIGATDQPDQHVALIRDALDRVEALPVEKPQPAPSESSQPGEGSDEGGDLGEDFGDFNDDSTGYDPDADDEWGDDDAQTDNDMGSGQGLPGGDEDDESEAAGGADGETEADEADEAAAGSGPESAQDAAGGEAEASSGDETAEAADEPQDAADEAPGGNRGGATYGEAEAQSQMQGEGGTDRNALDEALPLEPGEAATQMDRNRDGAAGGAIRQSRAVRDSQDTVLVEHDTEHGVRRVHVRVQQVEDNPAYPPSVVTTPDVQGALAAAFVSRRTSHDARTVSRSGRLSGHRVYRAAAGFDNVFMRREGQSADRLDVHLLVDASGSMAGPSSRIAKSGPRKGEAIGPDWNSPRKVDAAAQMAANMAEALSRVATVRTRVWSHNSSGGTSVWDIYDQRRGDQIGRMGHIFASGGNNDASAIRAVGQIIKDEAKPREQSVLVVISDGLPNEDTEMVRSAAEALRREGIGVLSVAIDGGLSEMQEDCYGPENVVPWEGDWDRLGQGIAEAMGRLA